jgi:uncharacterized protein (DUF1330 family)
VSPDDTSGGVTLAMIARVPVDGIADFQRYEDAVIPLLAEHGARLERRLRSQNSTVEIHIVSFPSGDSFQAFMADPRRGNLAPILKGSGTVTEAIPVHDVVSPHD